MGAYEWNGTHSQDEIIPVITENLILKAYPNPFKDNTTLSYILPENQLVHLSIYNLKGQKVFSLQDAPHQKGLNTVTWSGADDFGRQVSSGIYFSKLITSGKVITSKMVMLK